LLTPEEDALWRAATRSVRAPARAVAPPGRGAPSRGSTTAQPARVPAPPRDHELAAFDLRQARKIATGRLAIEASIDLHGERQATARARLQRFLRDAQVQGLKMVLVITGQGRSEPSGADRFAQAPRGVLRRLVPLWLAEPELARTVLSFTTAGPRHGGAGALYVRLRRFASR
jgi:DNA-nicking Smr family endonuclease